MRKISRRTKPWNGRQLTALHVFSELVKHISLWNFYFSFFMTIFIRYGSKLVIEGIVAVCNECFLMNILFMLRQLLIFFVCTGFLIFCINFKIFFYPFYFFFQLLCFFAVRTK